MIVTVNVKGQAILYLKNNEWNVVFITDDCHRAKFSDSIRPDASEYLAKPDVPRTVLFGAEGLDFPKTPPIDLVNEFLNMSLPGLHGIRSPALSNLQVKPNPHNGRQFVHLRIPFGEVTVTRGSQYDYFVEPFGSGMPRSIGRPVASEFAITFEVSHAAGLTVTIQDDEVGADKRTYTLTSGPLELTFDNDCDRYQPINDFINIYDWVYDISPPDGLYPKRFVAGKLEMMPPEESLFMSTETFRVKGKTGDCDPVIIEPPPGD